jgi:amino acid transporter
VTAEECKQMTTPGTKKVNSALYLLFAFAIVISILVPAIPPYASILANEGRPLLSVLLSTTNEASDSLLGVSLLLFIDVPTQLASAAGSLYAASRYIYSLSRAGTLPSQLSITASTKDLASHRRRNSRRDSISVNRSTNSAGMQSKSGNAPATLNRPTYNATKSGKLEPVDPSATIRSTKSTTSSPAQVLPASALPVAERLTSHLHRTPIRSVAAAAILAFISNIFVFCYPMVEALISEESEQVNLADRLVRMSVWVGSVGYAMQLIAYIRISLFIPTLHRPSPSPAGIYGATLSLLISVVFGVLGPFIRDDDGSLVTLVSVVVLVLVFIPYYFKFVTPRLTESPERLFTRYELLSLKF